jgi:hypothetical protein
MKDLENIDKFIDVRRDAFRTHGPMYGSNEAVEMQAITLIEMEYFINYQSIDKKPSNNLVSLAEFIVDR